jgi:Domain of unknown function (DUF4926)
MHTAERPRSIPELSIVSLKRSRECEGKVLPEGTTGAVVYAYRDGAGYEVEFAEPFHCVLTVGADDIQPV